MMDFDENAGLEKFAENIRPHVKAVMEHKFGLTQCHAILCDVDNRKMTASNMDNSGDRFSIKLNYCKKVLTWRVLMNADNLLEPPDFIMEDNFLLEMDVNAKMIQDRVPSLANWSPQDDKALLNVILELLNLYKEYQLEVLKSDPRLHRFLFEYETLISMTHVAPSDVELCVHNNHRNSSVIFYIRINVDFSGFPQPLPDAKNLAVLMVEFKYNGNSNMGLTLCEEVENTLGGVVELPDLPSETSLMDYVPCVADTLQNKISDAMSGIYNRRELCVCMMQILETSSLSLDTLRFTSMVFLLGTPTNYYVVQITIPEDFPATHPKIKFTSTWKTKNGNPVTHDVNNYPFCPRWKPEQMADKMCAAIRQFLQHNK